MLGFLQLGARASVVQVYIPYLDIDLRPAEQLPDAEAKIWESGKHVALVEGLLESNLCQMTFKWP